MLFCVAKGSLRAKPPVGRAGKGSTVPAGVSCHPVIPGGMMLDQWTSYFRPAMKNYLFLAAALVIASSCKKDDDNPPTTPGPRLVLKFKFDSTQVRLNNLGLPSVMPAGHAGQSPRFNSMSAHYVEFAPDMWTPLGSGDVVYHAPETAAGGAMAIDFSQSVRKGEGEAFLNIPLSQLAPGTYEWLRVSLGYQNYDIDFAITQPIPLSLSGSLASFIGYNTYITSTLVKDSLLTVNDDRLQGFWAFETIYTLDSGSAAGAITVPNPINGTSPIPAGSCVVTGAFSAPLVITGNETQDVVITVSLSTNKSFEWIDPDGDNVFEPGFPELEQVVDMGIRGLIPIVQ